MIKINNREIGGDNPAYIIAEMGINHNGSLGLAMKMIEGASRSRVDAVKVQIISADESYTRKSKSYSIFKRVELKIEEWRMLVNRARELGIDIFSTFVNTFDLEYAKELDLSAIKISSANITNFPLLEAVAALKKPVLMSTGMSYLSEVDEAVRFLNSHDARQIALLQCTSLYPTQADDVNLRVMETLSRVFPSCPVGFSDHTMGINCALAAVAMEAKIIEKHFTLDRNMEGPDHHFSATPQELKDLVRGVREVEHSLGRGVKAPAEGEVLLREKLQRSIVAAEDIKVGSVLTPENLAVKRALNGGLPIKYLDKIIGRCVVRDIAKDEPITWGSI